MTTLPTTVTPSPALLATLNALLARAGWEVEFMDLDATCGKATVRVKRVDGRWVHLSADQNSASLERWDRRRITERPPRGRRGMPQERLEDSFLGRERCDNPFAALSALCTYLVDNPAPGMAPLQEGPVRALLTPAFLPQSLGHHLLDAAMETILEGHILHVRAERLPGRRRTPRRDAMPPVDLTLGPDARGAFLVVDYSRRPCGEEERYEDARHAVKAVWKQLGEDRARAIRAALTKVHGASERPSCERMLEEQRTIERGRRMRRAFEHRGGIVGPLFGPSGYGSA